MFLGCGFSYLQLGNAVFDCGNNSRPFVVDWDSDGRKNVLCGSQGGDVQLLLNVGSDSKPAFQSAVSLSVGSGPLSVPGRASPVAFDWNRDGKKDLLVGDGEGQVRYFENVGTDAMPVLEAPRCLSVDGSVLDVAYEAAPSVADWNNDGEPDLICGSISDRVSGNVWLPLAPRCGGGAVFNIKGNEYRIVVAVKYQFFAVYILFIGTHAEYDKIDVATIWGTDHGHQANPNRRGPCGGAH